MKQIWHVRDYQNGDEQRILQLRNAVFGDIDPVRLTLSSWHWQFKDNPAGEAFCRLAEDSGTIVGQYAAIPTRFFLNGRETLFAFSCDTMTHPEYRRQGIFMTLAKELYRFMESQKGITSVWGFPNEISLKGFTKRLGWNLLASFPPYIIPIRPLAMLRAHIRFLNRHQTGFSDEAIRPTSLPDTEIMPGLVIEPVARFDHAFDDLWNEHKDLSPVIQIRDSLYLNWRYLGNPAFGYRPFAVFREGYLSGYMIIRLMNAVGHYFGVLADFFPFPIVDRTITLHLLRFARDYCKAHGAEFLSCMMPRANGAFLKKAGFLKIPASFSLKKWYLGCRYKEEDADLLRHKGNWYVTFGDTDIV